MAKRGQTGATSGSPTVNCCLWDHLVRRALRMRPRRSDLLLVACALGGLSLAAQAQQPRTLTDGVYTELQAQRGQAIYKQRCSPCHGTMLEGKLGPPLTGPDFVADFSTQPLATLAGKIQNTMPANDPGHLAPQQAADLVAYILQVSKFPPGRTDLS